MKTFVAKDHISALNIFRISQGDKMFTKSELKQTLKNSGIPSNEVFVSELRKTSVLTQIEKDQFKFTNSNIPVYYGLLENVYKGYHSRVNKYQQTYRKKKNCLLDN